MHFEAMWFRINLIQNNTNIRNWTAKRGYLGDEFIIKEIQGNYVVVETPNAQTLQLVPRKDFEAVLKVWKGYCKGTISRTELAAITRFSKYITSILNYLESESEGEIWKV